MRTFIDPKFWSDRDIDNCKSGSKLTALWLITCQYTSQIGVNDASEKRFSDDTGLPAEALGKCLEALPKCFVKVGDCIFIRNFIRHQFGSGESLKRNNFFIRLKSLIHALKNAELKALILEEYPEFLHEKTQTEGLTKGLPSPRKGRVGNGTEGEEGVQREKRSLPQPTSEFAQRLSALFGRRPTTAWAEKEIKALNDISPQDLQDLDLIEAYYDVEREKPDGIHRRDLYTLLNNYAGELDRAVEFSHNSGTNGKKTVFGTPFQER